MFKILQKTVATGIAPVAYPDVPAVVSGHFRGRPEFDFPSWRDARPAAEVCPTGAIAVGQGLSPAHCRVTVDYGLCIFCGQCADASPDGAVRVTTDFELATHSRASLIFAADYSLNSDGTHNQWIATYRAEATAESAGEKGSEAIHQRLGRLRAQRPVGSGSFTGGGTQTGTATNPTPH